MNQQKRKKKHVATKQEKPVETTKDTPESTQDKPSTSHDNVKLFSSFLKVKKALMRSEEDAPFRVHQQQQYQNSSWHQPQRDPTPPVVNDVYYVLDSDEEQEMLKNTTSQAYQERGRNEDPPMEIDPSFEEEPLDECLVPAAIIEEEVTTTQSLN